MTRFDKYLGVRLLATRAFANQDRAGERLALRTQCSLLSTRIREDLGVLLEELLGPSGADLATADAIARLDDWFSGVQDISSSKQMSAADKLFSLGAWIGESIIGLYGGQWVFLDPNYLSWRVGMSRIFVEVSPFKLADAILQKGHGGASMMIQALEGIARRHIAHGRDQPGVSQFDVRHYVRLHTVPLVQCLAVEVKQFVDLLNANTLEMLIQQARRYGNQASANQKDKKVAVDQLIEKLARFDSQREIAPELRRRILEAVCETLGVRCATIPIAVDHFESLVIPAAHSPTRGPPTAMSDDDLQRFCKGVDPLTVFLGTLFDGQAPNDDTILGIESRFISSPYLDDDDVNIAAGEWVAVDKAYMLSTLKGFDPVAFMGRIREFVRSIQDGHCLVQHSEALTDATIKQIEDIRRCFCVAEERSTMFVLRLVQPVS